MPAHACTLYARTHTGSACERTCKFHCLGRETARYLEQGLERGSTPLLIYIGSGFAAPLLSQFSLAGQHVIPSSPSHSGGEQAALQLLETALHLSPPPPPVYLLRATGQPGCIAGRTGLALRGSHPFFGLLICYSALQRARPAVTRCASLLCSHFPLHFFSRAMM